MSAEFELAMRISPLTTLVRGAIEWMFPASSWDELYAATAPNCKTRKLMIGSVALLMVEVVAGARRSLFAAFKADQAEIEPTITATYQALNGRVGRMAPAFSCTLVRKSAKRCSTLLKSSGDQYLPGWKEFQIRIIDGTQPDGSEHRLKVLRRIKAAGLPCRFVVQFDPASRLPERLMELQQVHASSRRERSRVEQF